MHGETAVLADGNSIERIGIATILRKPGLDFTVSEAESFDSLAKILERNAPALLVVDSELDGLGGCAGVAQICESFPELTVCVTVQSLTRQFAARCVSIGVSGCIEKTHTADDLFNIFKALGSGGIFFPKPRIEEEDLHVEANDVAIPGGAQDCVDELTPRQRAVLAVMVEGQSNKAIARTLGIREGTVKVHLAAAYRTLGVQSRMQALRAIQRSATSLQDDMPSPFNLSA